MNCMPCCPTCKSNEHVGNKGFHDKHFGRLIIGLRENYYAISRRYVCYSCMKKSDDIESVIDQSLNENENVSVEKTVDKLQYNFMGWNSQSLPLLPLGRGSEFPAFLSWKAGVDKTVIDMMRPLFDKGFKPESFSNMLLELHTSEFTRKSLRHEYEIKGRKNQQRLDRTEVFEPLGGFADKLKYRGIVPTGRYFRYVYKSFHKTIRPFLIREVKKRDMDVLMLDVSYKEAKSLYQYRGKSVFRGLVTGLNQYGEVRLQFHIYTDSHEQMLSALEAFEKTRSMMGFEGVRHVIGDNPRKEKTLFLSSMQSVKEQQDKYDSQQQPIGRDPSSGQRYYDSKHLLIKSAFGSSEINRTVDAMREEMKGQTVGLDAEWNRILNTRGIQTGRGRIQWIQLAYRNEANKIRVLLLWVGDLVALPSSLKNLICDCSIQFTGNKVSGDLKYIVNDFNIDEMKSVDQKRRENVINLGMYARVRGVVNNANVSLRQLAELTLGTTLDKSLQTSMWTKTLTDKQKEYVAIDVAVSLEVFEQLEKKKDLSCRLKEAEAKIGTKVDLVPSNGNIVSMATRCATGVIVGVSNYVCPVHYKYKNRRCVNIGKRTFIVRVNKIYAPGLVLPGYRYKNTKAAVTLGDLGEVDVVLPLGMLTDHVLTANLIATKAPADSTAPTVTSPSTESTVKRRSERGRVPLVRDAVEGYGKEEDRDVEDEETGTEEWKAIEDEIDDAMKGLTSENIETLRAAVFESQETARGRIPLQCANLDLPPKPELIEEKFSAVLGDVFHAMDRTKVPVKHEAKKSYFVALREAFLVWNPTRMKELETRMSESGMTEEEIEQQKYFNARLFRECVERKVPSPKILYWRVRAVYALFGNMVDGKTNKPLFNKKAWKKANNVLRDILDGFYSDPPGLNFYTKKLGKNGDFIENKYGMEVIECFRGTNRTESYHKNLSVTFGSWSVGVEMSDCLLAERRHRHNHKCSERRRLGFPVLGHYDTWLVDQLQNLVKENHGIQMFPHWTNASDYKSTNETFDTIALHHQTLDDKLEQRCRELGPIALTREQEYMSQAMGTRLPFLPFVSKEESLACAEYVLDSDETRDYDQAAEDWIKYVNGKTVMPKLPAQLRTYDESWSRNMRIKECMKNARSGNEKIKELNGALTPQSRTGDGIMVVLEPEVPKPLPQPQLQAMKDASFEVVGGILVGENPMDNNRRKRGNENVVCVVRLDVLELEVGSIALFRFQMNASGKG